MKTSGIERFRVVIKGIIAMREIIILFIISLSVIGVLTAMRMNDGSHLPERAARIAEARGHENIQFENSARKLGKYTRVVCGTVDGRPAVLTDGRVLYIVGEHPLAEGTFRHKCK